MDAAVIGAGRAGSAIASLLAMCGVNLRFITRRAQHTAREFADRFPGCVGFQFDGREISAQFFSKLQDIPSPKREEDKEHFLLFLTVKDDALLTVASLIASVRSSWQGFLIYHCSGGQGLEPLQVFKDRGGEIGVLHPCYPILGDHVELPRDGSVIYTFEGSPDSYGVTADLIRHIGGRYVSLPTKKNETINRAAYHAGNVFASGHLVTLLQASFELLQQAGVGEKDSFLILSSLTKGTLSNVFHEPTKDTFSKALTGPFVRGDKQLIEKHREAISATTPHLLQLYDLLGALSGRAR